MERFESLESVKKLVFADHAWLRHAMERFESLESVKKLVFADHVWLRHAMERFESLESVKKLVFADHAWLRHAMERFESLESLQNVVILADHAWLEHAVLLFLFESVDELLVGGSSETLLDHLGLVHALHLVELVPSGGTEGVTTGGSGGGGDNESFSLSHAEKLGRAGHGDGAGLGISGAQVNDVALLDVDGLAESSSRCESESRFHSKSSFFVMMIYLWG